MLALAVALAAACATGALAYKPPTVAVNSPPVEISGAFKPTRLPKDRLSPIHLELEGTIDRSDPSQPALHELVLEVDKNLAIGARGLAPCGRESIEAADTATALRACKSALVGAGVADIEVEFPQRSSLIPKRYVSAFNGGVKGEATTIYLHTYLGGPMAEALVIEVKVTPIRRGRYGTKLVATVPTVASGNGALKEFDLELFRLFAYRGRNRSYLLAKCPDRKLHMRWNATFADGSDSVGHIVRPCTPKG